MRKDYIADSGAGAVDEIGFIEQFWTDVWEREGGPKGAVEKLGRKPEYRTMAPYLARMPGDARLLDGGCGLGDWTLFFHRKGYPTLGLDISRATVARLKEMFPEGGFEVNEIKPIHKWQGMLRMLHHLFGLPHDWFLTKGMAASPGAAVGC